MGKSEALMNIHAIEPQISQLSRAEKAELLQRLAQEVGNAWAGIEKTAGVSGGEACIVRTRIPYGRSKIIAASVGTKRPFSKISPPCARRIWSMPGHTRTRTAKK